MTLPSTASLDLLTSRLHLLSVAERTQVAGLLGMTVAELLDATAEAQVMPTIVREAVKARNCAAADLRQARRVERSLLHQLTEARGLAAGFRAQLSALGASVSALVWSQPKRRAS